MTDNNFVIGYICGSVVVSLAITFYYLVVRFSLRKELKKQEKEK